MKTLPDQRKNYFEHGKNSSIDQLSPAQPYLLIELVDNSKSWSTKTGGRRSDDPFYQAYASAQLFEVR